MKIVDSNKKIIPGPELIAMDIYNSSEEELGGIEPQVALIAIAKELTMDDVEAKQFGNTVFVGHYTEDKTGIITTRALNLDTARNFINNVEKYFKYLLDEGVDKMYCDFYGSQLTHMFKIISKRPFAKDMRFNYFKLDEDTNAVEVILDPSKNPEPETIQPLLSGVEDMQDEPL
jgi:hypothetical protein